MKKRGFSKYLLTWLLALVMFLGTFSAGTAPVYAAETTETNDYYLEYEWVSKDDRWTLVRSELSTSGRFALLEGPEDSYGNHTYGIVKVSDLSIAWNNIYFYFFDVDHVTVLSDYSGSSYDYYGMSVTNWEKFFNGELQGSPYVIYSFNPIETNVPLFSDLASAVSYIETGDSSGAIDPNIPTEEVTPEDEATWKQVILDTIETWFGGTLEIIAIPLQAIAEGIGTLSTKILELRDYLIAQLPSGISNALSKFFEGLDNGILQVYGLLKDLHDFFVDKAKEIVSYLDSIVTGIDNFNRSIIEGIAGVFADLTPEAFKEIFRSFYDAQMEMLNDLKNFIISINDFMGNGFDYLKGLATDFSTFIENFFKFSSLFLEFSVDNPVTDIIFAALRQFLEPLEALFIKLFVPDRTLIETEFAALREKLGFIDDLQTAGVYLLNFFKNLGAGTPPVININLGASRYRDLGEQVITLDFSWYAEYKPTVDKLLAGIIWATFIWNMFKRLPDIIQGAGMIAAGSAKIENDILSRSDKSGGSK